MTLRALALAGALALSACTGGYSTPTSETTVVREADDPGPDLTPTYTGPTYASCATYGGPEAGITYTNCFAAQRARANEEDTR